MKKSPARLVSALLSSGAAAGRVRAITPMRRACKRPRPRRKRPPSPCPRRPPPRSPRRARADKITGSFQVSNDFVIAVYAVEHAVMLYDMHGFITRDEKWELPVESQVLGFMQVDLDIPGGLYELYLPLRPQGTLNDVDNDGQAETGVQVFATAYAPQPLRRAVRRWR